MKYLIVVALALTVCAGSFALADGDGDANDREKPKAVTPIQKILKALESMVAREKAKPEFDEKLVKDLEKLVKTFKQEAKKPIKLEDLTEKDRDLLKEEVRKELAAEAKAAGEERAEDWRERSKNRQKERALEGVDLTDKQREKVESLLGDFADETASAYQGGDMGMINELKKDLEKRLKREVGNKKARQIINNVNKQLGGRGRWGR